MLSFKRLFFLLYLIFSASQIIAQSNLLYSAFLIPEELKKNADDVIRLENKTLEIKSTKEAYLYYKQVVTILNEDSDNNVFGVGYDEQSKVKRFKARIYNAAGNMIRKVDNDEIKDVSAVSSFSIYDDSRVKYIEVTHNEYPYTIEYEYELSAKGIMMCFLPDWKIQGYRSSIQDAQYQIKTPKELKLHYKAVNFNVEPEQQLEGANNTYTWKLKNVKAMKPEAFSPSASSILPRLWVTLDQFEINNYKGSFRSWEALGAFMHQLYEGRDKISEATRQELLALTANAETTEEKIEILYRYLQKNMRYVSVQLGIGGWQPFDAAYVEKNKYGDCKALTNYMKSMLKVVDVQAYPVLIYSDRNPDYIVTEDFTNAKFNHVILNVPSEGIWLECTSSDYPINYIGLGNADRNALMITEKGGKLVKTPQYAIDENRERNKVQIQLDANGSARIKATCNLHGAKHEAYRGVAFNYSREDFEKWFRNNSELPSFTIKNLAFTSSDSAPEFELKTELKINNYASKAGKRLFVPLNKINPFNRIPAAYEDRKHPVVVRMGYTEEDEIEIHLPEGYQLESAPKTETKIESQFGSYISTIEKKDNSIVYRRYFVLKATQQAATRYEALCDFFKAVSKADNAKMVLVQKKS